jgi:hypothetical protein
MPMSDVQRAGRHKAPYPSHWAISVTARRQRLALAGTFIMGGIAAAMLFAAIGIAAAVLGDSRQDKEWTYVACYRVRGTVSRPLPSTSLVTTNPNTKPPTWAKNATPLPPVFT